MESRLAAVLGWMGRTGDESEREWVSAVLAEAEVLPAGRRRAWLRGGVWFALLRRRPRAPQVVSAWVGVLYAVMSGFLAWSASPLAGDAPDLPMAAAVEEMLGAGVLGVTFLVVSVRPLVGMVVAAVGLPVWGVAEMAAAQMTIAWTSTWAAPPPAGMAVPDDPFNGVVGFMFLMLLVFGPPVLVLLGAVAPSLVRPVAGPRGADATVRAGGGDAASS